jgi:hypothetical protein
MSTTRVLFLPAYFGFPSHFIPLVKLYQRMPQLRYDAAFLLPQPAKADIAQQNARGFDEAVRFYYGSEFLSHFNLPVLQLKQQFGVLNEIAAYREFNPDLIIDDTNLTTILARQIRWLPRLALARNGVFGDCAGPKHYKHSLDSFVATLAPPPRSIELPASIDGYFEAEAHIVPATRSIEPMPGLPDGGRRALYSGPLILNEGEEKILHSEGLRCFCEANRGRQLVYVTFGADAVRRPHRKVWDCLRELLRREFAVITNIRPADEADAGTSLRRDSYFHSATLPMHYVCSRADLIIHVCGSATYHYPILHGKPTITIGTQCRDREGVAQALVARGLSLHLPAPTETDGFGNMFAEALDLYESACHPFDEKLGARHGAQRLDIAATAAGFDIEAAIDTALSAAPVSSIGRLQT